MKKCLLLLALAVAAVACDKDSDYDVKLYGEKYNYATSNNLLSNGLIENNIQFYGTSTSTNTTSGDTFTDKKAYFELTASNSGNSNKSVMYMHATRFMSAMPGVEMRIPGVLFTGTGKTATAALTNVIPEADMQKGSGYQPFPAYPISDLSVKIEDTVLTVSFVCTTKYGAYQVTYNGRMIVRTK